MTKIQVTTPAPTWFAAIADTFWQHADGYDVLYALCAAKVPTADSPVTPDELLAWLADYVERWGMPEGEQ